MRRAWSPRREFLYFWSDRDGSPCLWAQRLEPGTKRPTGVPLGIQHFHSRGLSWRNLYLGAPDIAVALATRSCSTSANTPATSG